MVRELCVDLLPDSLEAAFGEEGEIGLIAGIEISPMVTASLAEPHAGGEVPGDLLQHRRIRDTGLHGSGAYLRGPNR